MTSDENKYVKEIVCMHVCVHAHIFWFVLERIKTKSIDE